MTVHQVLLVERKSINALVREEDLPAQEAAEIVADKFDVAEFLRALDKAARL